MKFVFYALVICVSLAAITHPVASSQRLFLVGYSGVDKSGNSISGCDGIFVTGKFPSLIELEKNIVETHKVSKIYITSLYEFKSRAEYDLFWQGWKPQSNTPSNTTP